MKTRVPFYFFFICALMSTAISSLSAWGASSCIVYNEIDGTSTPYNASSLRQQVEQYNTGKTEAICNVPSGTADEDYYEQAIYFMTDAWDSTNYYTNHANAKIPLQSKITFDNEWKTLVVGNWSSTTTPATSTDYGAFWLDTIDYSLTEVFACGADTGLVTIRNAYISTSGITEDEILAAASCIRFSDVHVCYGNLKDDPLENPTGWCDNDQDGYTEATGDCDDEDASINPGASETPNDGIDQDCDGSDGGCTLAVTPTSSSIVKGDSQSYAVTYTGTGGYDDKVRLSLSGIDFTLSPFKESTMSKSGKTLLTPSGSSNTASTTIKVSTTTSTPVDAYSITFSAASSSTSGTSSSTSPGPSAITIIKTSSATALCSAIVTLNVTYADTEDCENGIDDDGNSLIDSQDTACSCSDPATWYYDEDGDTYGVSTNTQVACDAPTGYVATSGDCDDTDATLTVDCSVVSSCTDPTTWYYDGDGDEYGDDSVTASDCDQPSGYISVGGDCDDADQTVTSETTWYQDLDGDGYGNPSVTTTSCSQPTGYVSKSGDCNDTDKTINPDATDDAGDGSDQNCDGIDPSIDDLPWDMVLNGGAATRGCSLNPVSSATPNTMPYLLFLMVPFLLGIYRFLKKASHFGNFLKKASNFL